MFYAAAAATQLIGLDSNRGVVEKKTRSWRLDAAVVVVVVFSFLFFYPRPRFVSCLKKDVGFTRLSFLTDYKENVDNKKSCHSFLIYAKHLFRHK